MSLGSITRSQVHSQSRSLSEVNGGWSTNSGPAVNVRVLKDIEQKLDELPQYLTQSRYEKRKLAARLMNKVEMTRFFSDYLQERNVFVVVPRPQPPSDSETRNTQNEEQKPTLEETIVVEDVNRESLVERLSDFSLKLHITLEQDRNTIEMSLQVGDQLIEWTRQNVIIPHKHIPLQTLTTIDLSQCLMKTLVSRKTPSPHAQNTDVDDRVLKLCSARSCLVEHIVNLTTISNSYYYYEIGAHDSQQFIKSLMGALKIDSLPHLSKELSDYITDLSNAEDVLPVQDHTDLDNYVSEHVEGMSAGMMEYMALMYYKHHLKTRAEAEDAGSETWKCPQNQCQLKTLLLKLLK